MKLLRVKANHFKNCADGFTIDFVARSRKTAEDKEYELQEIAPDLHVYNTMAFIGKNASGKTSAVDLLDCAYSIIGGFRLENKHYSYEGIELEIFFYHEGYVFLYETSLENDILGNRALFRNEKLYCKKYFKSTVKTIYSRDGFERVPMPLFSPSSHKELDISLDDDHSLLPDDTSRLFYTLGKKITRAIYFDSHEAYTDSYRLMFNALKNYGINSDILIRVLRVFDDNVESLEMLDDKNYLLKFKGETKILSDAQLVYLLSSGTTKGLLLYVLMVASLREGFDLLIDEVENHFHKTLVENMISLYKDKSVNRNNATLIFTTHYCEVLDLMGRQDNIWICNANSRIHLTNMYGDFNIRPVLLKSKQYYNNAFRTAVNYEDLMALKKVLKK